MRYGRMPESMAPVHDETAVPKGGIYIVSGLPRPEKTSFQLPRSTSSVVLLAQTVRCHANALQLEDYSSRAKGIIDHRFGRKACFFSGAQCTRSLQCIHLIDEAIAVYTRSARDPSSRNLAYTPVIDSVSSSFKRRDGRSWLAPCLRQGSSLCSLHGYRDLLGEPDLAKEA